MKKTLRFLFKAILVLLGILLITFVVLKITYKEDLPQGQTGEVADELAYKVLEAIEYDSFKKAKAIHWTFRGKNRYEWSLQENIVYVFWDNYQVTYFTKDKNKSKVFIDGKPLQDQDKEKEKALDYAINNFNNDSFWVVAPFKLFDNGTTRSLIQNKGKEKLLVQYNSGGTTPGDAYLWELDEDHKPISFKMWVSIIPFNGIEAKWSEWKMTDGEFPLAYNKTVFGIEIPITDLKVIP